MKIIQTHEQADFDAMASLLGAYLLDEASIPVLPHRVNRNVRAYLNLYGNDLPFIEARDLPSQPVEHITLVDTQSLTSVKGATSQTRVHVIDHHPLREDLPQDWNITVSGTGANTTIFIETLRERDVILSTVQSTLLLLGIYEDTGSLTYTRTTARDLKAASYLLEMGASLQIATEFLNHPLSTDQQIIYDQLRANLEHFHIHGFTVIVATGNAQEMDEELSTIVHKLRDLLDPDGLFVLIKTKAGVQLIARSNTDNIDVSQIAGHFGGGGHDRAAACLIKNMELDEIRTELVGLLEEYIRPSITVAQIMSISPQLLAPNTPVQDAAQQMQRFGHEGYPVIQDGKVIGLLTRRAVDRAVLHQRPYIVTQLMDAGEYIVRPDDSIEYLQHLMAESGWGQIPVIHPETNEVIGIVTRTDLLKILAPRPRVPDRQNMADRLEHALPKARLLLVKVVAQEAVEQNIAVYIVGGFVRDLLLERPSLDYDLVVEGDAIALARALARKYGGRVTSHSRFGTAKWLLRQSTVKGNRHFRPVDLNTLIPDGDPMDLPDSLDIVSARTEFYTHPTALPTVERGSIKLDLHRRDFTINTLALRLDGHHYGELHDHWGGWADLRQGLVRVLHSLSFVDDPTRILRAVRFEQRFDFHIEKRTLELLQEAQELLGRISGDRIRHELNNILAEECVPAMLSRLDELGILAAIHTELMWDQWLRVHIERLQTTKPDPIWQSYISLDQLQIRIQLAYMLWLIRLPVGPARNVCDRLKLPANLRVLLNASTQLWQDLPGFDSMQPSQIAFRLQDVPPLAIYAVYIATDRPELQQALNRYVGEWRHISPVISGHDLRALGVPPGPVYSQILQVLRAAWLDGKITTPDQENQLIHELLDEVTHKGEIQGK